MLPDREATAVSVSSPVVSGAEVSSCSGELFSELIFIALNGLTYVSLSPHSIHCSTLLGALAALVYFTCESDPLRLTIIRK